MATLSYSEILQLLVGIRDERQTHANTADRVGTALIELLRYLNNAPYLHKDREDQTNYLLRLLAGAVIGEGSRIRLNPDGSISCGSLKVDGSAIFNELVINHQNVLEGDTYFADRGIIDSIDYLESKRFRLTMRKMYDNDRVTFHAYDVLKCAMNNLDAGRTYRTSWMRVDSVDLDANTIDVTLYDDEDVPGGTNYNPEAAARIIRWGNQIDPDRQQVFFVSSVDGRFLFLQGVTKPILDEGNYSAFIGLPPEMECLRNLPVNKRKPYIYARGLIVQDIIKVDYLGNPQYTARDLGFWNKDTQYVYGYDELANGFFADRVWWGGCLWQAAVAKPTVGKEPRYNNADWVCLLGGDNMTMEIVSSEGDFFAGGSVWSTTLVCEVWNAEMRLTEEEIGVSRIVWQRVSDDVQGDVAWNIQHPQGTVGLQLEISSDIDVPQPWSAKSKISFVCSVLIPEISDEPFVANYTVI